LAAKVSGGNSIIRSRVKTIAKEVEANWIVAIGPAVSFPHGSKIQGDI
jgi:hypothetical protein